MAYLPYPQPPLRHPRLVVASLVALVAVAALAASVGASDLGGASDRVGASDRAAAAAPPRLEASTTLVVNEIDYDQPGTDSADFVELRNIGSSGIDLDPYSVELVNGDLGGATVYRSIDLPGHTLAAGDYYVICGASASVPNCDLDLGVASVFIQNGAPDAVAVLYGGAVVDTVSYEGDTGSPYTEDSGSGLADTGAEAAQSISRMPDGTDTDHNNQDLGERCASPGETNRSESTDCVGGTPTATASGPTASPTATGETPTVTLTPDGPPVTPASPTATFEPATATADAATATAAPATATAAPATATPLPATTTPSSPTATTPPAPTTTPASATATTTPEPLAVTLEHFVARRSGASVVVRWRTASEVKNAGFHVYREVPGGRRERITRRLVTAAGSSLAGADYALTDLGAPTRATHYWLADFDIHGSVAWHGPATVGPSAIWGARPGVGRRMPDSALSAAARWPSAPRPNRAPAPGTMGGCAR